MNEAVNGVTVKWTYIKNENNKSNTFQFTDEKKVNRNNIKL